MRNQWLAGDCMPSAEILDALFRYARHYMRILSDATNLYDSSPEGAGGLASHLFDLEWENIRHARALLLEASNTIELYSASTMDRADRLSAIMETARINFLLYKHNSFGIHLINRRRPASDLIAWLEPLLASSTLPSDSRMEILTLMGRAYDLASYNHRAIECFSEALEFARKRKDRTTEGHLLSDLGSARAALGEYECAIDFQKQSLQIMRELGNRSGESHAMLCLAMETQELGDDHSALDYLRQALSTDRSIGDRMHEARVLAEIAHVDFRLGGTVGSCVTAYQQALGIARQTGDRVNEALTLTDIAWITKDQQQIEQAIEICRELNLRRHLILLGDLCMRCKDYRRAIECLTIGLPVALERGDSGEQLKALLGLADAYKGLGENSKAIEYLDLALPIAREFGNRVAECHVLRRFSDAHDKLGNADTAVEFFERTLTVWRQVGDSTDSTKILDDWLKSCDEALAANPHNLRAMAQKGFLLFKSGDPVRGLAYLDRSIALDGDNSESQYLKGLTLATIGGCDTEARQLFSKAEQQGLFDAVSRISRARNGFVLPALSSCGNFESG